jgi:hypothetical protein
MGNTTGSLVPFLVALSFAAGLNVYATTGTLGILGRLGWVTLPPGLDVLASRWVIGASVACFTVEFFADKVPYFDLVWNVLHTFVRIPLAALMAYRASIALPPEMQWALTAMAAAVATVAHGSKTAARTLVTASPEPLTNAGMSSGDWAGLARDDASVGSGDCGRIGAGGCGCLRALGGAGVTAGLGKAYSRADCKCLGWVEELRNPADGEVARVEEKFAR